MLYWGHLLCRKSVTPRTYRESTWSVPKLYDRLMLPAVLCIQATSSCSKSVHLEWERQWGPRKMVPWSQTSSEDARAKPRPHRINVTYLNGKRARIIRAAGNYAEAFVQARRTWTAASNISTLVRREQVRREQVRRESGPWLSPSEGRRQG